MVLVSLDSAVLNKEDTKSLGEAINRWTLDMLINKEFHNVPEILEAKPAKLVLVVKVKDTRLANLVRCCAAKVNRRAFTAEELEMMERPLRRINRLHERRHKFQPHTGGTTTDV